MLNWAFLKHVIAKYLYKRKIRLQIERFFIEHWYAQFIKNNK